MNFYELFNDFKKSTFENFPVEECNTPHSLSEKHFLSDNKYLCLVIKPSKGHSERRLIICQPAVYTNDNGKDEFIWMTGSNNHVYIKNAYTVIENEEINIDSEYVYAFVPYNDDFDEELYLCEILDELVLNPSKEIIKEE